MITPSWVSACPARASTTPSTPVADHGSNASRRNSLIMVAIWSLRDRPARSRPPSSRPTSSFRPRSSVPCTSSSVGPGSEAARRQLGCRARSRPIDHRCVLVLGQQAGPPQRVGVGSGAGQIVGSQPPVEMGGLAEREHRLCCRAGEPAAPELAGRRGRCPRLVGRSDGLVHEVLIRSRVLLRAASARAGRSRAGQSRAGRLVLGGLVLGGLVLGGHGQEIGRQPVRHRADRE